jgi:hypothetical protein
LLYTFMLLLLLLLLLLRLLPVASSGSVQVC